MPPAIDPGDRKLLTIVGAVLLVLVGATILLSPSPDEQEGEGVPTTYSTTNNGTQAAYLLLQQLGYKSQRWENRPTELPNNPKRTILILTGRFNLAAGGEQNFPEKGDQDALLGFVRKGGWVIYSGNFPFLFVGTGNVDPHFEKSYSSIFGTHRALAPSSLTRDAPAISMYRAGTWQASEGTQVPLYGDADGPVAVTWKLEKGRVIWWAAPTPITNAGITREGNLAFFLGCIQAAQPGVSPGDTTVLWDEYFHGYRGSLWDYFRKTPVPWALYQLAFVAVFIILAFSRRSGPLVTPAKESRLSPLEFVDTLGDLYRRARAGSAAVRVEYQRFRTLLVRRLALSSAISNAQLDAAVRERLGWKQPGFMSTLQSAEAAVRQADIPSSEALKIVQALEHYEVLFGLKTRPNEEKR
jgi:hypothetical protein